MADKYYKEITLEETYNEAHVPATLHYHENQQVYLVPVELSELKEVQELKKENERLKKLIDVAHGAAFQDCVDYGIPPDVSLQTFKIAHNL